MVCPRCHGIKFISEKYLGTTVYNVCSVCNGEGKVNNDFNEVKDSGNRQEFVTGSKRDIEVGKGNPSLIPTLPMRRLAKHYENGAKKYGRHNWTLGQPLSRYIDSLERHVWAVKDGMHDEDHEAAVLWNMMSFMVTKKLIEEGQLPAELDDMVYTVEDARRLQKIERPVIHHDSMADADGEKSDSSS
jgi:hypothetical protein